MEKVQILWADDEISLLKPHILFLKEKGYDVSTATSGDEALDLVKAKQFDIVFLDENMPVYPVLTHYNRLKVSFQTYL